MIVCFRLNLVEGFDDHFRFSFTEIAEAPETAGPFKIKRYSYETSNAAEARGYVKIELFLAESFWKLFSFIYSEYSSNEPISHSSLYDSFRSQTSCKNITNI